MRLFKTECLREPLYTLRAPPLRFAPRYGAARPAHASARMLAPLPGPEPMTMEHERAVLRALARMDRAA